MQINSEEFGRFITKYYRQRHISAARLGQAFINEYFTNSITDSELFYCDSAEDALVIITQKYVYTF